MTQLQEKTALIQFCDTSHWRSVVGLTLNLKQSVETASGGFVRLDELAAKKAFPRYMKLLNRRIYNAAFNPNDDDDDESMNQQSKANGQLG